MRIKSLVGAFLCLLVVSSPILAQSEDGKKGGPDGKNRERMRRPGAEGGPGMPGAMMGMIPVMAALDADKDGSLSVSEIANASKSLLTLDKNGDGVLNNEELRPASNPMAGGGPRPGDGGASGVDMARMFDSQDANKDGKLTGDEIPERMRERVAMIDEDGDGAISRSEMQKVLARMAAGGKGAERAGKDGKDGSGVRPKRPGQDK